MRGVSARQSQTPMRLPRLVVVATAVTVATRRASLKLNEPALARSSVVRIVTPSRMNRTLATATLSEVTGGERSATASDDCTVS